MGQKVVLNVADRTRGDTILQSDRALMEQFLDKPGFLLARVDQICRAMFSSLSERATLSQAEFLLLLDRLGPMIQIELARAAGVDKSTTAFILNNLQARGWIIRSVREHDRRSSQISLTSEGEALLPEVKRDFAKLRHQLESPLEFEAVAMLTTRLRLLGQNADIPAPSWRAACDPVTGLLDASLSFLVRRALQLMQAQFLSLAKETHLTLRQFSLLLILSQRQSITQTQFSRIFGIDPATCAVIMRGPARRRLIASKLCPHDRRLRIYTLTKKGREILGQVHSLANQAEDAVFNQLTLHERAELVGHLRIIISSYSHLLRFPGAIAGE